MAGTWFYVSFFFPGKYRNDFIQEEGKIKIAILMGLQMIQLFRNGRSLQVWQVFIGSLGSTIKSKVSVGIMKMILLLPPYSFLLYKIKG